MFKGMSAAVFKEWEYT